VSRAAPSPQTAAAARLRLPFTLSAHQAAVAGLATLAMVLELVALDREGYANSYYAAAVLSMLGSWHNFFFVAFDPGGFLAVDKPPLGLWIQAASAKAFGFSGLSILLPQALAGVASVAILTHLVGRAFGRPAGLIAGLALALMPIAVVVSRNNTMDSTLVLFMLLAAWAMTKAVERGRLRMVLLSALMVGLAFNVKSLEAYFVLPGLALAYLVAAPLRLRSRLWHLVPAAAAVLVVSLSWALAVDLTPAGLRPYVTNSGSNSELSLLLGYNGLGRVTSAVLSRLPNVPFLHLRVDLSIVPTFSPGIGDPGLFRLLSANLVGQVGWLLPLAVFGLVAAVLQAGRRGPGGGRGTAALAIWVGWLVVAGGFFSVARFFHLYYLVALGPAVAAAAGFGSVALWQEFREGLSGSAGRWWRGWLLPAAVATTATVQANALGAYPGLPARLAPALAVGGLLAAGLLGALLVGARFRGLAPGAAWRRLAAPVLGVSLVGLLVAPAAWSLVSITNGNGSAWLPQAGPATTLAFRGPAFAAGAGPAFGSRGGGVGPPGSAAPGPRGPVPGGFGRFGRGGGAGALTFAGPDLPQVSPSLISYLEHNRGGARYLVATMTTSYASLLILQTGQPVMTLGGYQGWDRIVDSAQLASAVSSGTVRFFLVGGGAAPGFGTVAAADANTDLVRWITSNCSAVPQSSLGTATGGFESAPGQLYDCRARG